MYLTVFLDQQCISALMLHKIRAKKKTFQFEMEIQCTFFSKLKCRKKFNVVNCFNWIYHRGQTFIQAKNVLALVAMRGNRVPLLLLHQKLKLSTKMNLNIVFPQGRVFPSDVSFPDYEIEITIIHIKTIWPCYLFYIFCLQD